VERGLPVVALGCCCSDRWEPTNGVESVSQQLAGEPLAQQVVKALQIVSFISDLHMVASERRGVIMWDLPTVDTLSPCQRLS